MLKFGPKQPSVKSPQDVKLCKTCKHFVPDSKLFSNFQYGKCRLFGEIDPVTGETKFNYASLVRKYENECGEQGLLHAVEISESM
jgi:hypothetical protein